jgi:hypothetical protein
LRDPEKPARVGVDIAIGASCGATLSTGETMTGTLLFVHGTGVRTAGYNETFKQIRKGLTGAGKPEIALEGIEWGETLGVRVDDAALDAILPLARAKSVEDTDDAAWQAALWGQLLVDPLFELRMAAVRASAAPPAPPATTPGAPTPADVAMIERLQAARRNVADPLPGDVTAQQIRTAIDALMTSSPLLRQAAIGARSATDVDLVRALARAIVAQALATARGEPGEGPDALYVVETRTELVDTVALLLAPATKDVGGWLFGLVKDFALGQATAYGKGRRQGLMGDISPGVGDILLYQRRGTAILDAIESKIAQLAQRGPVAVLGHSLGGVMLVDLLSRPRQNPLPVSLLITVGSQAPMFLKCDALDTMRLNQPLPAGAPYTPWLNVFDRNDFLSFCAGRTFGAVTGIEDFEISSGVPFPDSHGAYFRDRALYKKIASVWP